MLYVKAIVLDFFNVDFVFYLSTYDKRSTFYSSMFLHNDMTPRTSVSVIFAGQVLSECY